MLIYKNLFYTLKITKAKLFSEISFLGLFSAPWLLSHLGVSWKHGSSFGDLEKEVEKI